MAGSRVPIASLPEATSAPTGGLLVVQDGATTKKIDISLVAGASSDLAAHINDPLDAHHATAVSTTAAGILTGVNVQQQLGQAAAAISADANNLTAHIGNPTAAHAATAVSASGASGLSGATVQAQLGDAATKIGVDAANLANHIAQTSGAHAATAISATPSTGLTGATVQDQLGQVGSGLSTVTAGLATHLANTVGAHNASAIAFAPSGSISATTVQAAILEVAAEAGSGGGGSGGGTVTSVNGDAGPSVNLDASEIPFSPVGTIGGATVQAAVAEVATDAATALTGHNTATLNVHGIANTANLVLTNDARLSNNRAPTAHAASHQDGGVDELVLDASQIVTGVLVDGVIPAAIARDSEVTAAVAAHTGQASGAHAASAVSFTPTGAIAASTVQTAVAEVATDAATALSNHIGAVAGGAHGAGAIAFTPTGTISATNVQAAIAEVAAEAGSGGGGGAVVSVNGETGVVNLVASEIPMTALTWVNATEVQAGMGAIDGQINTLKTADTSINGTINNHIANASGAHAASAISFIPTGLVVSNNVQAAIAEVAGNGVPPVAAAWRMLTTNGSGSMVWDSHSEWLPYIMVATAGAAATTGRISVDNFTTPTTLTMHLSSSDSVNRDRRLRRLTIGDTLVLVDQAGSRSHRLRLTGAPALSGSLLTATVTSIAVASGFTADLPILGSADYAVFVEYANVPDFTTGGRGGVPSPGGSSSGRYLKDSGAWATPAASEVSFSPTGTIAATTVQGAIAEVASEAFAGLNGATGLWIGTQAQYDAIGSKVSTVVYIIT